MNVLKNIVYVHSGKSLPLYLIDSIFQTILVNTIEKNKVAVNVHVLLDQCLIGDFYKRIEEVNWGLYNLSKNINVVSIESLNVRNLVPKENHNSIAKFRDGFWIHTTSRFLIIGKFLSVSNLSLVFHIENDVMMYKSFDYIYKQNQNTSNKIWVVKDSPKRVIPSIVFFPNAKSATDLVSFIHKTRESSSTFLNDMDILGVYPMVHLFPTCPTDLQKCVYDGAAIGQFLGGIDPRNKGKTLGYKDSMQVYNESVGFINETSDFDARKYTFHTKRVNTGLNKIDIPILKDSMNTAVIANLHIHSKNLAMFSSVAPVKKIEDIISGDRVLQLCDLVITTRDIYDFHKSSVFDEDRLVIIKDFSNVNGDTFRHIIDKFSRNKSIKIFVYTHILENFQKYLLPLFNSNSNIILYTGNSDHVFDSTYSELLSAPVISCVYAQNLNIVHEKCTILPIGIANAMWVHGDIPKLHDVMLDTCKKVKPGSMYVNVNPRTFQYRQHILDICLLKGFRQSTSKKYKDYLYELSSYKFCLCIRGNGIDTHRFWEALYLGVIPVIINNNDTDCGPFVENLKNLGVPFYEVTTLGQLHPRNFTFNAYKNIIREYSVNPMALLLERYK